MIAEGLVNKTCMQLSTHPRCSCEMCHRIWQVACAFRILQLHSDVKELPFRPGPSRQIQHSSPCASLLIGCSNRGILRGSAECSCPSHED